ncbi:MAG: hypothetical protein K2Z81_16595 [Cyanobacteria bacterium]|nr:hypothetical protein [Cyanobacteriota bacterium]
MKSPVAHEELTAEAYFEAYLKYECSPHALKKMVDDGTPVHIIDMRSPETYGKSHVPGAVNVELKEIEDYSSNLDKSVPVVVYCYDTYCMVAARGALRLAKKGFSVQKLIGGYDVLVEKYPGFGSQSSSCSSKKSSCG